MEHNLCSAAVLGQARLPTLEGQKVNLTCGADDRLHVNGNAVSQADIMATNGVIHVLNDILIPDSGTMPQLLISFLDNGCFSNIHYDTLCRISQIVLSLLISNYVLTYIEN